MCTLVPIPSDQPMVCAGHQGRHPARLCRVRFRRRRHPHSRLWRHDRVRQILQRTVRVAGHQVGVAQAAAATAGQRSRAVSAARPLVHDGRRSHLSVRRAGERERGPEEQHSQVSERSVHAGDPRQSADLGPAHDVRRESAAARIAHGRRVHVQAHRQVQPGDLRRHERLPTGRSVDARHR